MTDAAWCERRPERPAVRLAALAAGYRETGNRVPFETVTCAKR